MDFWQLLRFGLVFLSLILSLLAWWGYRSLRAKSKLALDSLHIQIPIRALSVEEQREIEHLLNDSALFKTPTYLISQDVYLLTGNYLGYLLENNGQETTLDTLNLVEVLLPYDAKNHLYAENNVAEIVVTNDKAIVLKLNETFELLDAQQRYQAVQQVDKQWQAGIARSDSSASNMAAEQYYEIIRQRDETTGELRTRHRYSLRTLSIILFIFTFICFYLTNKVYAPEIRLTLTSLAGIFLFFALFCYYKKNRVVVGKVNQIKGYASHIDPVANTLQVAQRFNFSFPPYWANYIKLPLNQQVDLDVRVSDNQVLRFGRVLSIDWEAEQKKPGFFIHHLLLMLLGGIALITAWAMSGESLVYNLYASQLWLNPKTTAAAPISMEQLAQAPLAKGQWIRLKDNATCQVSPYSSVSLSNETPITLFDFNCDFLRWHGQPIQLPDSQPNAWLAELKSDELVPTVKDVETRRLTLYLGLATALYGRQIEMIKIKPFSTLVNTIDQLCATDSAILERQCSDLKRAFINIIKTAPAIAASSINHWPDVLKMVDEVRKNGDAIFVTTDDVRTLESEARMPIYLYQIIHDSRIFELIRSQQHGGILINQQVSQRRIYQNDPPRFDSQNLVEQPFYIEGMITGFDLSSDRDKYINIDVRYIEQLNQPIPPPVVATLFFLLAALLFIWQGCALLLVIFANWRRDKFIADYYSQQI